MRTETESKEDEQCHWMGRETPAEGTFLRLRLRLVGHFLDLICTKFNVGRVGEGEQCDLIRA